jgi:hypothetical protein
MSLTEWLRRLNYFPLYLPTVSSYLKDRHIFGRVVKAFGLSPNGILPTRVRTPQDILIFIVTKSNKKYNFIYEKTGMDNLYFRTIVIILCFALTIVALIVIDEKVQKVQKVQKEAEETLEKETLEKKRPRNIYVFGSSTEETGNLVKFYPTEVKSFNLIPNTNLRLSVNPTNGSRTVLGPRDRHSEGCNYLDFMAEDYHMDLVNSSSSTPHRRRAIEENDKIVNYAVSGATVIGNRFSSPILVPGPHGFDSQVDMFVEDVLTTGKVLTHNDVVMYCMVHSNDVVSIISAQPFDPAAIPAQIATVVSKTVENIKKLYTSGARQIYIDSIDAVGLQYLPASIKIDALVPGTLALLQSIIGGIFQALRATLEADSTMPGIHISIGKIDGLLEDIFGSNYWKYGLPDSFGDRDSSSSVPTLVDSVMSSTQPNVKYVKNSVFVDDSHLSQIGQRSYATFKENRIAAFNV